jgi:hypothetical protein
MTEHSSKQPDAPAPVRPAGFYLPGGEGSFESMSATASPWDPSHQHGGPPSALLARAIERCEPRADTAIARITIDFLGGIPQGEVTVKAEVIRPGRRIELVEARMHAGGRLVASATAWRAQIAPDSAPNVPAGPQPVPALPGPQPPRYRVVAGPAWGMGQSTEWRFLEGSFAEAGPARAWARTLLPLVAGEQATGLQRTLVLTDSANALSSELDSKDWLYIPPGLTLAVLRDPEGEWLMLDAHTGSTRGDRPDDPARPERRVRRSSPAPAGPTSPSLTPGRGSQPRWRRGGPA